MANGLKIAGGVCLLLDLASVAALVYYGLDLVQHGAPSPDSATGQIVAIHNKSQLLYVTQAQINVLYGLVALNIGLTTSAIILFSMAKRRG